MRTRWLNLVEQALGARRPRMAELLAALDEVNPTPHTALGEAERAARYAAKARLQSRLIEAFPYDLELRRDGEALVLGLRGGRDAKHVVRHQLEAAAQAWVGRELARLDIDDLPEVEPEVVPPTTDPVDASEEDPEDHVGAGDYERAVAMLAARRGDPTATVRRLEILLDYLDQPAEAVTAVGSLPAATAAHPGVTALHALALVRCGRVDEAERALRRIDGPASGPAWREVGAARISARDDAGARRAADRIEAADRGLVDAAEGLRRQAAVIVEQRIAGELDALQRAVDEEAWGDVGRLAAAILVADPGSRRARSALADARKAQAESAAEHAFAEASRLEQAGRWRDAAARFRVAAEAGRADARARAESTERRADREDRDRAVSTAAEALVVDPRDGLLRILALDEALRADVRAQAGASGVRLLDALDALPLARPEARVAAAMAKAADRPHAALEQLEPHLGLVERSKATRPLLAAIRERVQRQDLDRATALLDEAERALPDPHEARRRLARIPVRALDPAQRTRLGILEQAVARGIAEDARVAAFDRALEADPFVALRLATGTASAWVFRRAAALDALRTAYRIQDLWLEDEGRDLGAPIRRPSPFVSLDLGRGVCWVPEAADHWITLSEVPIDGGPIRRGIAFRAPRILPGPDVTLVDGGRAWVETGWSSMCIDLERGVPSDRVDSPDLLMMAAGRDGVWWKPLVGRWRWQRTGEEAQLLDPDLETVDGVPGRDHAVATTRAGEVVELAPDGARRPVLTLGAGARVLSACAHPTDPEGLVIVVEWLSGDRTDILAVSGASSHLVLRFEDVDRHRTVATARSTGLLYVLERGPPGAQLSVLSLTGAVRFVTAVPTGAALFCDPAGERCALVYESADRLRIVLLGDEAPELEALGPYHAHGAPIRDCGCEVPDGLEGLVRELEIGDDLQPQRVEAALNLHPVDPVHAAKVVSALALSWADRAEALSRRLDIPLQAVPMLGLSLADDAVRFHDYQRISGLLSGMDLARLPAENRAHGRHLRALASIARGDLAAARRDLRAAMDDPGECPIAGLLDWVEVVEASDPVLPEPEDGVARSWWDIRRAIAAASEDKAVATRAMAAASAARCDHPAVVAARARALLDDPDVPFWTRLRGLARLGLDSEDPPIPSMPSRDGLVVEGNAWLEGPDTEAILRSARLLLAEVDGALVVRPGVAYGGIVPDDRVPWVEVGGRLVRRCPSCEAEVADRFARDVSAATELLLDGEAAFRFLDEQLPALSVTWEVHAQHRLTRIVPARPAPRTAGGKVSLGFETDTGDVAPDAVLQAWLAGRHYVRVDEHTVARLPAAWLQRHALELQDALADEAAGDPGPAVALEREGWGLSSAWTAPRVPPGLRATLRPYQLEGFYWLVRRREAGIGACLADEMGLGKTVQAIACLLDAATRADAGPFLIVAPASLLAGWREELLRFAPELGRRTTVHHGQGRPDTPYDGYRVVLTTYETLRADVDLLRATRWAALVLDEAQRVRNPASRSAIAVRSLTATFRLAITGTPLENRVEDLVSVLTCAEPASFGPSTLSRLRQDASDELFADRVGRRVGPLVLRRRKSEVASDLPPVQEVVLPVDPSPEERELYRALVVAAKAELAASVAAGRGGAVALATLTRLRQAACDPSLLDAPGVTPPRSSKLAAMAELVSGAVASGHGVLVFSSFVGLLDRAAEALRSRGVEALRLDGRTRLAERQRVAGEMGAPGRSAVCLLTYGAGGVGLNLVGADHVVLLDPWWNPAVEGQAIDRAHRIGQLRPVLVHRLVSVGTIEDQVRALGDEKRRIFHAALEGARAAAEVLALVDPP